MKKDYVVLLHGLGRTQHSMAKLASFLKQKGYQPINEGYPSTRFSIQELCAVYLEKILREKCPDHTRPIHFVTHSLGGILVRCYLQQQKPSNLGRVVMLAPPNQGSEIADWLRSNFLYRRFLGPAAQELGTGPDCLPAKLGRADFELGIIAGCRSVNPINSLRIKGPDDGKVSLEKTKLAGAKDFLAVNHSHPFIMRAEDVLHQTDYFLRRGMFRH